MSNVYFIPVEQKAEIPVLSEAAARLLAEAAERESFQFEQEIPLKVHFGEKGNRRELPAVFFSCGSEGESSPLIPYKRPSSR